ncbi:LAMI_0F14884g1_1 [Lachancea mirantina]|uniref:LAMI_0F14884g1_1 n=1 Tax=Lachancea mirantina TaxID=1230905 RepID=A0A1G4K4C7_9SACH|nr:LAMI_0F14884g1_1 [Lachancea mirantina]
MGQQPPSLCSLCEMSLMRNHLIVHDVANVPYRLIRNVLLKCKLDQLCKLEKSNVRLVFEDEEVWYELLKKDFPMHVHESSASKRDEICNFYAEFIEDNDPEFMRDTELMKKLLRAAVQKDPITLKYRVPSRMLYFKYQKDILRKQEASAQRLRLRTQELKQEKAKNQIVALEDPVYCEKQSKSSRSVNPTDRSGLFLKSYKESQKRQQLFRSGGFDASTQRPVRRVAFGGGAVAPVAATPSTPRNRTPTPGSGAEIQFQTSSPTTCSVSELPKPKSPNISHSQTSPTCPGTQRKKKQEQASIFLKRRKLHPSPKPHKKSSAVEPTKPKNRWLLA